MVIRCLGLVVLVWISLGVGPVGAPAHAAPQPYRGVLVYHDDGLLVYYDPGARCYDDLYPRRHPWCAQGVRFYGVHPEGDRMVVERIKPRNTEMGYIAVVEAQALYAARSRRRGRG